MEAQSIAVMAENSLDQIIFEMNNKTDFAEHLFITTSMRFQKKLSKPSIKANTAGNHINRGNRDW